MIKKLFMASLLSIATYHLEAVIAVGDNIVPGQTFQFSIGAAIYNGESQKMWTTTADDLTGEIPSQKYGIAYTPFVLPDNSGGTVSLITYPYLTSDAIVSQSSGSVISVTTGENPLLTKAFSCLTLVGSSPAVVISDLSRSIYYVQQVTFNDNAKGLNSSDGTSIINKFNYESDQIHAIAGIGATNLVVARATGSFGSTVSQLSFVQLVSGSFDGATYSCLQEQASEVVNTATPVLTAGTSALALLGESVTFYPSGNGLGMYVGLDVQAASGSSDRAVGLFTATGVNSNSQDPGSITYSSVIDDTVIAQNISTPISARNGEQIAVRNISTTTTSTGLGYMFVARDNGDSGAQSIYAMPIITMPTTNENFGKIADFNSIEQVFKVTGYVCRVQGFDTVITDENQIDIAGTDEVVNRILVGAGAVPIAAGEGYIDQLSVQGDAVYITIQEPFATGTTPGMFKSDALFDAQGRIMAWTAWQRVSGSQDQMLFSIKNRASDATIFVSGADSDTIQQTTWNSTGTFKALETKINSVLPQDIGGVQGIIPFPSTTQGFTALPDAQVSLVVTTGNSHVLVAQTGQLDVDTQTFRILPQTEGTSIILDDSLGLDIGSVVTAAFGSDSVGNNWLFMGGDGGLSVLSHVNGLGFVTLPNSGAALSLIDGDQSCKTFGTFTFVKKIVSDGNYLYVMTRDAVYQILLLSDKFKAINPGALNAVQVISAAQLNSYAYCLDMLVDQGVILLGTTSGLYSIDIQQDIPGAVTSIVIPQGLSAVSKIQALSCPTRIGFSIDYGFYSVSNLYVLSIDFPTEQARLNRFTIKDGVVTPIQDQLFQDQDGPLIVFDYMSNNMFIDGSLGFMTSYKIGKQPATLKYLQYTLRAGASSCQFNLGTNTTNISIAPVLNSLGLTAIVRDYASGSLLMAADFGVLADS